MKCQGCLAAPATRRIQMVGKSSRHTLIAWLVCDKDADALVSLVRIEPRAPEWAYVELHDEPLHDEPLAQ